MKANLSITFLQILFLIGLQSFAFDSQNRSDFDFSLLKNSFKVLDLSSCNDKRFLNAEIKVSYHQGKNEIEIYSDETLIQSISHLNKGKTEFTFCWKEGVKGFYLSEIFSNKITYKKAIYATGSLCAEASRLKLEQQEFTFTNEALLIKTHIVDDKNDQTYNYSCQLSLIRTI